MYDRIIDIIEVVLLIAGVSMLPILSSLIIS